MPPPQEGLNFSQCLLSFLLPMYFATLSYIMYLCVYFLSLPLEHRPHVGNSFLAVSLNVPACTLYSIIFMEWRKNDGTNEWMNEMFPLRRATWWRQAAAKAHQLTALIASSQPVSTSVALDPRPCFKMGILLTWVGEGRKGGRTHRLLWARTGWEGDGRSCHTGFGGEGVAG